MDRLDCTLAIELVAFVVVWETAVAAGYCFQLAVVPAVIPTRS